MICKQCLKDLPETDFRPYVSRSKGIRTSTVGHNTICKKCESINCMVTRVWRQGAKNPKEQQLLDSAASYYKCLKEAGGDPLGAYARYILDKPEVHGVRSNIDKMLEEMALKVTPADKVIEGYKALAEEQLVDIPDVYQAKLEALREQSLGKDGKILTAYKPFYDKLVEKLDDYEDNYVWKKPVN